MGDGDATTGVPLCPSAQPDMAESRVFGIVGGSVTEPRVGYLEQPLPVTQQILDLTGPVRPAEVFRFAAPCAGGACQHFDGINCRLARRVSQLLPVIVEVLPPCSIRSNCRWWQQEGKEACRRCPQVVTAVERPDELLAHVADPAPVPRL